MWETVIETILAAAAFAAGPPALTRRIVEGSDLRIAEITGTITITSRGRRDAVLIEVSSIIGVNCLGNHDRNRNRNRVACAISEHDRSRQHAAGWRHGPLTNGTYDHGDPSRCLDL